VFRSSHGAFVVAAVLAILVATTSPAAAGRDWCADDPVITIHGFSAHVTVGFESQYLSSLRGPIEYVAVVRQSDFDQTTIDASMATLPTTVSTYVMDDPTFTSYFGGQVDVVIAMRVNGKKDFATLATITSTLGSNATLVQQNGKSNVWVIVPYNFQ